MLNKIILWQYENFINIIRKVICSWRNSWDILIDAQIAISDSDTTLPMLLYRGDTPDVLTSSTS